MQHNKNSIKVTALYARFSRNDSDNESDSIANQRKILQNYAKEKGFSCTRFYADDGVSGTIFDRPDFQRMLTDIENGEIETVIVKDLSRFGRLSSMVGYYTDFYFPQNSIRFIAIFDDVDSENGDNEFAPFKNIFNEWYARDTSRKVKAVLKNKGMNGGILCSKPIYGYKKDPDNKNHWLIDEEAAEVVRLIFNLCTEENMGITRISNTLRTKEIPTPIEYFRQKGLTVRKLKQPEVFYWDINSILAILRNQAYMGDVVNFKTYRKSYKDHKLHFNDIENLVVYKGVNDPIVSEEQYNKAQAIIDKRRRMPTGREPDLFQGYVYCADCGKRMSMTHNKKSQNHSYVCNTYRRNTKACTSHYTPREVIAEVTLTEIRKLLYAVKSNPDKITHKLKKGLNVNNEAELKKAKSEIQKLQKRKSDLDKIIFQLYEDKALGKISEERYFSMVTNFESQQKEIREKISNCEKLLTSTKENTTSVDKFIEAITAYDDIKELNQFVLLDLVDKIVIRQRDGNQEYEDTVDVCFKEIGKIFF